jgi:hypothetical protein
MLGGEDMSTSYQIVCKTCKQFIYMGDIRYVSIADWVNRDLDEIRLIDDWDSYDRVFIRSALTFVVFQSQHVGHDVRLVTEFDAIWRTEMGDGFYGNAEALGYTESYKPLLYDDM